MFIHNPKGVEQNLMFETIQPLWGCGTITYRDRRLSPTAIQLKPHLGFWDYNSTA